MRDGRAANEDVYLAEPAHCFVHCPADGHFVGAVRRYGYRFYVLGAGQLFSCDHFFKERIRVGYN